MGRGWESDITYLHYFVCKYFTTFYVYLWLCVHECVCVSEEQLFFFFLSLRHINLLETFSHFHFFSFLLSFSQWLFNAIFDPSEIARRIVHEVGNYGTSYVYTIYMYIYVYVVVVEWNERKKRRKKVCFGSLS